MGLCGSRIPDYADLIRLLALLLFLLRLVTPLQLIQPDLERLSLFVQLSPRLASLCFRLPQPTPLIWRTPRMNLHHLSSVASSPLYILVHHDLFPLPFYPSFPLLRFVYDCVCISHALHTSAITLSYSRPSSSPTFLLNAAPLSTYIPPTSTIVFLLFPIMIQVPCEYIRTMVFHCVTNQRTGIIVQLVVQRCQPAIIGP